MYVIGLTGGIASGKSTVSGILRELGAGVVDADQISRGLTAPGGAALPEIRRVFGDGVFVGAELDRKALAARVFSCAEERERLNALMFPRIVGGVRERLAALAEGGAGVAVVDMPLLLEMGFDRFIDALWVCVLPQETQLRRLMARDGLNEEQARARVRSQLPQEAMSARADVLIDTSVPPEALRAQVRSAFAKIPRKE